MKAHYKSLALQRQIAAIDKGKDLSVFSIIGAMKILDLACQKVKRFTIVNCFAKVSISKEQQKSTELDDDDSFKDLQNQIEMLGDFYPTGTAVEDVTSADENLMSTVPSLTDEELIEVVMNGSSDDNFQDASQVLRDYMPFVRNGEDIQQMINTFAVVIDRYVKLMQSDIRNIFSTNYSTCFMSDIFILCLSEKK